MPARARWVAALAAAILASAAVALALASRPTEEERTEARAQACVMFVLTIFGGPDLAAAMLGETDAFPDEIDAFSGADASPDVTLADIDAAAPEFAEPLRELIATGLEFGEDEEPPTEEVDRYSEALATLGTACDEAGLLDQDGATDREEPDDPAARELLERMKGGADGAPSESD